MKYFRAFVAGMLLPAVLAPFLIAFLVLKGEGAAVASLPFLYFGPLLWGLWNMVFFATKQMVPINNRNVKIGVYGAVYGLASALINTLGFEFTSKINAFPESMIFFSIVLYPIILYVVWKYVINALNFIFDVY